MKREAVVVYLKQVIDLEVAKYYLRKKHMKEKELYEKARRSLFEKPNILAHREEPAKEYYSSAGLFGLFSGFTVLMILVIKATANMVRSYRAFGALNITFGPPAIVYFLALVAGLGAIYWLGRLGSTVSAYRKELVIWRAYEASLNSTNQKERERARKDGEKLEKLNAEWKKVDEYCSTEEKKLNRLLERLYNFNIIPIQHRTLPALLYIYDYMRTSEESLTDALKSQQFEDGVRRMEARLTIVIEAVREALHMFQENNEGQKKIVSQNMRVLNELKQIKGNSTETARYVEQISCYTEANAIFTLANYLDNLNKKN